MTGDWERAPELLEGIQRGDMAAERFVTHHFTADQFEEAYATFSHAADEQARTVIISRRPERLSRS